MGGDATAPASVEGGLWSIRIGIRRDLEFSRQVLRGSGRYVVHDPVTFQNHVFDAFEYRILTAIVPLRTLAEVFAGLVAGGALQETDRREFHDFVVRLHRMGLLQIRAADAPMLYAQRGSKRAARRGNLLSHFLYLKVPLLDPDRMLDRTVGLFGQAFSRFGVALWAALVLVAVWKCWGRFGEMFGGSASLLSLANIPVLFLGLTALKVVHEFGHAYACKRFGCEVPEMGVVMLFLTPCAYVDASASWRLQSRWQRIVIGLAGMYVESAVAAVAALLWVSTAPGLVRDIAANILVLATVVTVFFNINPLMRFDGYYVFSDLVGVPNLFERSRQSLRRQARRWFLGIAADGPHGESRRVSLLYQAYGAAAFVYKVFLAFAIVGMVFVSWPLVGTVLGVVFGYLFLVRPLLRLARYLLTSPQTGPVRGRARVIAYGGLVALPLGLAHLPVSRSVVAPAVLDSEVAVVLRSATDGFVTRVEGPEGARIDPGGEVALLSNEALQRELEAADAELRAEQTRLDVALLTNPAQVQLRRARVDLLAERWSRLQQHCAGLRVTAPPGYRAVLARRIAQAGGFVSAGDELAELHCGRGILRMVLTDQEVERAGLQPGDRVRFRWRIHPGRVVSATVQRVLPVASRTEVPSQLTVLGGGAIYGSGSPGAESLRADRAYLQLVLQPEWVPPGYTAGLTAEVAMAARVETLGAWLYRRLAGFYDAWRMS